MVSGSVEGISLETLDGKDDPDRGGREGVSLGILEGKADPDGGA